MQFAGVAESIRKYAWESAPDNDCRRLPAASLSELNPKAGVYVHRQAGISDGCDVLVIGQVFGQSIDAEPRQKLIAAAQVDLGVAMVEIAIGQQQTVAAVFIGELKIGGVIAAACKCRGKNACNLALRIGGCKEPSVRRAAERPGPAKRRDGADWNSVVGGRISS